MISLYSGTPGSGKSLDVARYIFAGVYGKHFIVSNFEISYKMQKKLGKRYTYVSNDELTPKFLYEFSQKVSYENHRKIRESDILLIIDEAQLLFNAREWNKNDRNAWLSFFTQHRKYGYNIILVAQFDRMLDRQVRSLIEYEYIHRKVSNYGWRGMLLSLWFGNRLFCAVKVWYPMRQTVGSEFFVCRKKYYEIYDTFKTW